MEVLIVTGMSGAGKSTAVNVLEDIGYYCIDNMPPQLFAQFMDLCEKSDGKINKVAFVVDIRGGDFFPQFRDAVENLKHENKNVKILFIDANDDIIVSRYKETRRKHPLNEQSAGDIRTAIATERKMLQGFKAIADYYLNSSVTSTSQFKERIHSMFLENANDFLSIEVMSFGFKYGGLSEGDLVFDVRCLPNPYYIPELTHKTGLSSEVSGYVMKFEQSQELLKKLIDLVNFLIPLYQKEGKSQLVIAFGCTGGKHRSVTFAEAIAKELKSQNLKVRVNHRDIEK